MKILITGANGQLGTALQSVLRDDDIEGVDLPVLDIANRDAVWEKIDTYQPNIVINAAAYTNVDGCVKDPTLAYQANGLGPQNLALACASFDIDLVQISTNEVFPGEKATGYNEWDKKQPINAYGNSKVAGEFHVRHLHHKHYIVRTAWLYAPSGRNFIHAILRFARERGAVRVVTDEIGNPTYVKDLAQAIQQLIASKQYGTYHLVNSGKCSRWEFANEILHLAGLDHVTNTQILSSDFQRASTPPLECALNNYAGAGIGIELRPWQAALADYMREHVLDY